MKLPELLCRAWAKGVGFSSGGRHRSSGDTPQVWDASKASAVQRVEDDQRGAVLRSLAAALADAQEPGACGLRPPWRARCLQSVLVCVRACVPCS